MQPLTMVEISKKNASFLDFSLGKPYSFIAIVCYIVPSQLSHILGLGERIILSQSQILLTPVTHLPYTVTLHCDR